MINLQHGHARPRFGSWRSRYCGLTVSHALLVLAFWSRDCLSVWLALLDRAGCSQQLIRWEEIWPFVITFCCLFR